MMKRNIKLSILLVAALALFFSISCRPGYRATHHHENDRYHDDRDHHDDDHR
jgi:hypothetical protein